MQNNIPHAWDRAASSLRLIPLLDECVRYAAIIKAIEGLPRHVRILEVGCGEGRILRVLHSMGFRNTYGLEISRSRLNDVRHKGRATQALVCSNCIPFKTASFDAIVSAAVIEHVENPRDWLCELARVIKPGGVVAIATDTYMWSWLKKLRLYRTIQPIDEAIRPSHLIAWGREAGLDLKVCGGFVNVKSQRWYFAKQISRLIHCIFFSIIPRIACRLICCLLAPFRRQREIMTTLLCQTPTKVKDKEKNGPNQINDKQYEIPIDETESILAAVNHFEVPVDKKLLACVFSYECFYWFRKC